MPDRPRIVLAQQDIIDRGLIIMVGAQVHLVTVIMGHALKGFSSVLHINFNFVKLIDNIFNDEYCCA